MNQQNYRRLISGEGGWPAKILCLFLWFPAVIYSSIVRFRNFLYSAGLLKSFEADAVVISIGNITAGGTGKTPLVIWLSRWLEQKKMPYAILTRGYKTTVKEQDTSSGQRATRYEIRDTKTDEPAVLIESCPEAKVVVNPDRVAGALQAVNEFGSQVLVMDDGFQHRRLQRDLDIVTIDSTNPFGYGKILPAGLLREPVSALKRASAVILTRCEQQGDGELKKVESQLKAINPDLLIARAVHEPVYARTLKNEKINLDSLNEKKVFAFCGIGNPDAFEKTLKSLNVNLIGLQAYDDHHHFTKSDITGIYNEAESLEAEFILTTQKDWTKISAGQLLSDDYAGIICGYLAIELEFVAAGNEIAQLLEDALEGKIRKS